MMLMGKDKSIINDVVDSKGYIGGRGELLTILAREKSMCLVVEACSDGGNG